jgi:hypothetical protein
MLETSQLNHPLTKTIMESDLLRCRIEYCIGQGKSEETSVLVSNLEEARHFAHMSLRFAVLMQQADNGAAELFDVDSGEKLGRMAVLFDEAGTVDHEQWTWVDEKAKAPLH